MKNLVLGMNEWLSKSGRVTEAMVPNWKLETTLPAGLSLPALISKLQDLSDSGVKMVKFREEGNGQLSVWSQQHSDVDDSDLDELDQLPFSDSPEESEPGQDLQDLGNEPDETEFQ